MKQELLFVEDKDVDYSINSYCVSESNYEAVYKVRDWVNWKNGIAILEGSRYSGKTHLSKLWQEYSGAVQIVSDNILENIELVLSSENSCFIIEDINFFDERCLLHVYNAILFERKYLLMTVRNSVSSIDFKMADLRSRLLVSDCISLPQIDDNIVRFILNRELNKRQVYLQKEVENFVMSRIDRSCGKIVEFVDSMYSANFEENRRITIPFVKSILECCNA